MGTHGFFWGADRVPFFYMDYELIVGLDDATQLESVPKVKD